MNNRINITLRVIVKTQILLGLLYLFDANPLMIRTALAFLYYLVVPGLLLSRIIKLSVMNRYELLVYSISLSVAFLMFSGLVLNSVFPVLGMDRPLSAKFIIIWISVLTLGLAAIVAITESRISTLLQTIKEQTILPNVFGHGRLNSTLLVLSFVFPLISIVGAILLNNKGSSIPAHLLIIGIALYVSAIVVFRKKIDKSLYPLAILLLSLSLLLSYSLRSEHVLGWDINLEYKMFQLTKEKMIWSIQNSTSIYNTCLSITVLPTVLQALLTVSDENIFKIVFQLIFCIVPLAAYLVTARYLAPFLAFLAAFFYMAQQFYYMQLSSVIRQEVAFIFFSAMILVLFNKSLSPFKKNFLFILFGISLVVSHYSTAYITVLLLLITYTIGIIYKKVALRLPVFRRPNPRYLFSLNLISIMILLSATVWWNAQSKSSYNEISNTANSVINRLGDIFTFDSKGSTILTFLFNSRNTYTNSDLHRNIDLFSRQYIEMNGVDTIDGDRKDIIASLHLVDAYPVITNTLMSRLLTVPYTVSKYVILLGLFSGIVISVIKLARAKNDTDIEYFFFSLSILVLMTAMVILPHISVAYNIERIFQQGLVFVVVPVIVGILAIFSRLRSVSYYLLAGIFIVYYVYQSGIMAGSTNTVIRVNLNNYGPEYDAHFIHNEDVLGIQWLGKNTTKKNTVYTDILTSNKFYSMGSSVIKVVSEIYPTVVDKNGYVFSSYTNTVKKIASIPDIIHRNYAFLFINYPHAFFEDNKNLIYNNGKVKIYR